MSSILLLSPHTSHEIPKIPCHIIPSLIGGFPFSSFSTIIDTKTAHSWSYFRPVLCLSVFFFIRENWTESKGRIQGRTAHAEGRS